jgi:hypothetical protein
MAKYRPRHSHDPESAAAAREMARLCRRADLRNAKRAIRREGETAAARAVRTWLLRAGVVALLVVALVVIVLAIVR